MAYLFAGRSQGSGHRLGCDHFKLPPVVVGEQGGSGWSVVGPQGEDLPAHSFERGHHRVCGVAVGDIFVPVLVLLPVKVEGNGSGIVDVGQGSSGSVEGAIGAFESSVVQAKGVVAVGRRAAVLPWAQEEEVAGNYGVGNGLTLCRLGKVLDGMVGQLSRYRLDLAGRGVPLFVGFVLEAELDVLG